ncbi:MAG: hypothetical protein D6773_17840 [Alphaproteobacteria bacterium]|nr:MAG: hypothetical protein D6773_17840 [Alphaproteobacteria bacterium]
MAPSAWTSAAIARHARTIRTRSQLRGSGHTAQTVTQTLSTLAPADARLAVDAGAHMFSALCFWETRFPLGVLKSNGLSTMGYALPAALASALHEPDRKALAISGDGGMMMCLGELRTAALHGCDITLVVINDAALSLIDIKQQRSQYASRGVRYPQADFAALAAALGCASWRVREGDRLEPALAKAIAHRGPAVVEVLCDPAGYGDQLVALRG